MVRTREGRRTRQCVGRESLNEWVKVWSEQSWTTRSARGRHPWLLVKDSDNRRGLVSGYLHHTWLRWRVAPPPVCVHRTLPSLLAVGVNTLWAVCWAGSAGSHTLPAGLPDAVVSTPGGGGDRTHATAHKQKSLHRGVFSLANFSFCTSSLCTCCEDSSLKCLIFILRQYQIWEKGC